MASYNNSNSVAFKINDTTPSTNAYGFHQKTTLPQIVRKESWMTPDAKIMFQSDDHDQYTFNVSQGFLASVYMAYAKHYHITISPDDIWLTIMFSFCNYMEYNAEEMRSIFVDHQDKKQMIIMTDRLLNNMKWEEIFTNFENTLDKHIKPHHREWVIPNFTTTTPLTRAISQIIFMGINKAYFSYGMMTECGIPSVTLEGTPEDWAKLQDKILRFKEFDEHPDLVHWATLLNDIVSKMIDSYNGNVDVAWWNQCIHYHGGSGTNDLSGWALAFFPFDRGQWQLNPFDTIQKTKKYGQIEISKFATYGSVHVPVKFNELGNMHDLMFYASSKTLHMVDDKVRPAFNYAIIKLRADTIKDAYDWSDTSVKHVTKTNSSNITIVFKQHPHQLVKTSHIGRHTCDVCYQHYNNMFYCQQCDFDVCFWCANEAK